MFFGDVPVTWILRDTAETGSLEISEIFCNSTPAPQVTGLSPLRAISERNCLRNADDPIARVPSPQDLKEVAEAVRLVESAPMPKTLKEKR